MIVSSVPSIAPHLNEIRSGQMRVFFHNGQHMVMPVLTHLGIADKVFFPPSDPPLQEPYQFCTPKMMFEGGTRPQYPRAQLVPYQLHDYRKALREIDIKQPCEVKREGIVILSRGNGSRTLSNEAEMAAALATLGRSVTVLEPSPNGFSHMLEVLGKAAILIGAHGANMANMMYAPQDVTVVEIVPQVPFDLVDFHFWDLAGALNLTYVPFGQLVLPSELDAKMSKDAMTQDSLCYLMPSTSNGSRTSFPPSLYKNSDLSRPTFDALNLYSGAQFCVR